MKNRIVPFTSILLLGACSDTGPSGTPDTSLDTLVEADTMVDTPVDAASEDMRTEVDEIPCALASEWSLEAVETAAGVGTISFQVDLHSDGVETTCLESPCLEVNRVHPIGTIEDLVQSSPSHATFTCLIPGATMGDMLQLVLVWKVRCTYDGYEVQEVAVSDSVFICVDADGRLYQNETGC